MVKANMTARNINLVLPLSQKDTAMRIMETADSNQNVSSAVTPLIGENLRQSDVDSKTQRSTPLIQIMLTTANHQAYIPLTTSHEVVGIGVLSVAANSRRVLSNAAFSRLVLPVMGGLGGESQDSQVPHLYANPSSSVHPIGVGCSVKRTMRRNTMSNNSAAKIRTTKVHPFFSCNPNRQALFSINSGIELDDALSEASCFLSSALQITQDLACDNDSAQAWAAHYLVEISKAIIDSAINSCEFGENHGK